MNKFSSIGRNMMISDKYFKLYLRDCLMPYELNSAEGIVLLMMYQKLYDTTADNTLYGQTQDELIRQLHYDKGVMTRTMKELEQKGYVLRTTNPKDSRSYVFTLSKKGIAFQDTIFDILVKWNNNLLESISKEDLEIVEATLTKMSYNASKYYHENHSDK